MPQKLAPSRIRTQFMLMVGCLCASAAVVAAADESSLKPSRNSGLVIPQTGMVRAGQGQRVLVKDALGQDQVALLHAEVDDRRLVMLPNGRLESVLASQAPATSQLWRARTKKEITAEFKVGEFKSFKTRSSARYVYVYNASEEFCKGTRTILETMYPAILDYFKRQKLPVHDPAVPLVAIMFRTEDEFRKYEAVPPGVAAYYDTVSNRIVMYEQSRLVEMAPDLAVKQSIGTIAHEGIHQILHNIGVQDRLSRWPLWTSEGLAEYFAPTSVDERLHWKGVGKPHDLRMYELDRFLKQPSGERGQMVEQTVCAARLTSTGYASAWGLTHYLASRQKEKFHSYLRAVAKLGPLEPRDEKSQPAEQKKLFTEFFGADFGAIEDEMIKHLKGLPYVDPVANQTHYVVLLDARPLRSASVTASPAAVRKWQEETLTRIPPTVRAQATFRIVPFANRSLAEDYAKQWLRAN